MRILVVGAGAVGGYVGARLIEAGADVTFMVRRDRAAAIRRDGLRITSPHGDATLRPPVVLAADLAMPYDLILLSVKGDGLETAIADMAPAVGSESAILPVLNGMRHMDRLERRFGREAVLGGVCRVATKLDRQGGIIQIAPLQQIAYGELDGSVTPRLRALDAAMQGTGLEASLSPDIVQALWDKWVQLASLGAVTCLFRGPIGAVSAVADGKAMARALVDECAAVAAACGRAVPPAFLEAHRAAVAAEGSPLTSSMYRDLLSGSSVEVEEILGDLIDRGTTQGVETPLLRAAAVHLRVYQGTLAAGAAHD